SNSLRSSSPAVAEMMRFLSTPSYTVCRPIRRLSGTVNGFWVSLMFNPQNPHHKLRNRHHRHKLQILRSHPQKPHTHQNHTRRQSLRNTLQRHHHHHHHHHHKLLTAFPQPPPS